MKYLKYVKSVLLGMVMSIIVILFFTWFGFDGSVKAIIGTIGLVVMVFFWQRLIKRIPDKDDEYPGAYYAVSVLTVVILTGVYMMIYF